MFEENCNQRLKQTAAAAFFFLRELEAVALEARGLFTYASPTPLWHLVAACTNCRTELGIIDTSMFTRSRNIDVVL